MAWPNTPDELAEAWALRVNRDWRDTLTPYALRNLSCHDTTRLRIMMQKAIELALVGTKPPCIDENLPTQDGGHWYQLEI